MTALARPGEDAHFVDAKPSFIVILNKADVLIEGGAALEAGWLPPLLDAARNPRIALGTPGRVIAADGIADRQIAGTKGHSPRADRKGLIGRGRTFAL